MVAGLGAGRGLYCAEQSHIADDFPVHANGQPCWVTSSQSLPLPSTALIQGEDRFQLRRMDDATECFEAILKGLHMCLTGEKDADDGCIAGCLAHSLFGHTVLEQTNCSRCHETSEPLASTSFVAYVSMATFLERLWAQLGGHTHHPLTYGELLRQSVTKQRRSCSNELV